MANLIKYLLLTSALALLMIGFPLYTLIFAIFWGTSLIIAAIHLDLRKMLGIVLLNLALIYLMGGFGSLAYCLTFFAPAALTMSYLTSKCQDYYYIQKWGIIAAIVGVTFFICLIYANTGQIGIEEREKQLTEYINESMEQLGQSGILEYYQEMGIDKLQLEEDLKEIAGIVAKHLPSFYYLQTIMVAFFMLLIASIMCRRANIKRLIKRPYENEIMPWHLSWIVIAGLIFWLLGRSEENSLYYAGSNMLAIMAPICIYFGLSAVLFSLKKQRRGYRKWYILALITLSILFLPSALIFLCIVGVFDSLVDYRKIRLEKEDGV
ncbi:MAG: DUF2232 domain-containing protein [Syntrophomonadaceae bacterium]|jgi:uncharacterized protein YybS (DUF2232 family)